MRVILDGTQRSALCVEWTATRCRLPASAVAEIACVSPACLSCVDAITYWSWDSNQRLAGSGFDAPRFGVAQSQRITCQFGGQDPWLLVFAYRIHGGLQFVGEG